MGKASKLESVEGMVKSYDVGLRLSYLRQVVFTQEANRF